MIGCCRCLSDTAGTGDTWVFPLVGLPPLAVSQDSYVTRQILQSAESGSMVHLATGYFNLTDEYTGTILRDSKAAYRLLMAHPTVSTRWALFCFLWNRRPDMVATELSS